MKYPISLLAQCLVVPCFLTSQVSFAQTLPGDGEIVLITPRVKASFFEEVVVTAQKRAESRLEVPITISSYSGEMIEKLGISNFTDLAETTPGVTVQSQSASTPTVVIRGISSDEGGAQDAPRVSIYLNDVDVSRNRGSMFELYDLESIEVIKGPQASLFGTAASIGAIQVRTKGPEEGRSSQISYGQGNFDSTELSGFLNRGNGQFDARFAFKMHERDGYVTNIASRENLMGFDRVSLRPSIGIQINDKTKLDLIYTHERNNDSGVAYKSGLYAPAGGDTNPFTAAELAGSPDASNVFERDTLGIDRTTNDVNAQLSWQASENLSFKWISGIRDFDVYELADSDGSAAWALEIAEDTAGDQISQEWRANWDIDGQSWVFGLSYFQEDSFQKIVSNADEGTFLLCLPAARSVLGLIDPAGALGLASVPCQNPDSSFNSLTPLLTGLALPVTFDSLSYVNTLTTYGDNESISAYIDGAIDITDALRLNIGLRAIREDRQSGFEADAPNSLLLGVPLALVADTGGQIIEAGRSDTDILPRIALNYQFNDKVSIYASWSEGRKSALTQVTALLDSNFQPLPPVTQIPAEEVTNIELGLNAGFASVNLAFSAALFQQSYENFQIDLINTAGQFIVTNAGAATNNGFETELQWEPLDGLGLRASYAYIDAQIDEGSFQGQRFRLQPETSYSLSLLYEREISSSWGFYGSATYAYQSEVFFDDAFQPVEPRSGLDLTQSGYGIARAKFGLSNEQGLAVEFWVDNLTDEDFLIDAGNGAVGFGAPTYIAGAPRMVGLRFTKNWQP